MSRRTTALSALYLVFIPIGVSARDSSTAAQDYRIRMSYVNVVNAGRDAFNSGDHAACCHIYQGGILAILPQLDYRLDLQKSAKAAFEAATQPKMSDRAFALRAVLDNIYKGVIPKLWDRLGGETTVKAVVHDFVELLTNNPKVDVTRGGKFKVDAEAITRIERLLVEQISSATGGPIKYSGRDMKTVHGGMMITNEQFDAGAGDLIETLKKHKVGQQEINELAAIIAGTRKDIVMAPPSLYTRLGGEPAISAVVDDFVGRAAADPAVNFSRKGTAKEWNATPENVARVKKGLVDWIGEQTGGPQKYTGKDMKSLHQGMMISDAEFTALAADLKISLEKHGVAPTERDELLKLVAAMRGDMVEKK